MSNNSHYSLTLQRTKKSELVAEVACDNGKFYTFHLKKQRIHVSPKELWFDEMPIQVRDEVLERLLRDFRERSHVSHDIRSAALGITQSNDIVIAVNTENRGDNDFPRDCAEQNMVNTLRQSNKIGKDQKFKSVYVLGGKDNGEPSIICPCGNCTDTLAREMVGPRAEVVVLPVRDHLGNLSINTDARSIFDVQKFQGWRTHIGALNTKRELTMDASEKRYFDMAFDALAAHMPFKPDTPVVNELTRTINPKDSPAYYPAAALGDVMASGSYSEMARYMQQHAYEALSNRLQHDAAFNSINNLSSRKDYIAKRIASVQVAIAKTANGEFHEAIVVNSDFDRASLPAVTLAVLQNQRSYSPITDVWSMEFNPTKANQGKLMTPSKESIERAIKRGRPDKQVAFHVLPFARQSLPEQDIAALVRHYDALELSPGYFTGRIQSRLVTEPQHLGVLQPTSQVRAQGA